MSTSDPILRFFHGGPAPERLVADLATLSQLPEAALVAYVEILEPHLGRTIDDRAEAAVTKFCRTHGVTDDQLLPGIRACRQLLFHGLEANVPPQAMVEHLGRLIDDVAIIERLVAAYHEVRNKRRQTALVRSLGEHGKTVMGIDWRLDTIRASQHGGHIDAPLVFLTFRYQRGDAPGRVTLQLMPDMVDELRAICDALVGKPG